MRFSVKVLLFTVIFCLLFIIMTPITAYSYNSSSNIGGIYGSGAPTLNKEKVSVKVGSSTTVGFSFGETGSTVQATSSNLGIEVEVIGTTLHIKGLEEGQSWVTLYFNDGTTLVLEVDVTDIYGNSTDRYYDEDIIEIKKGKSESIYIDLDEYDSYRATISVSSTYVSVNKSTFTSSGYLKITGKKIGDTTLKVKYSSGETVTYDIEVVSSSGNSNIYGDEELYIDLEDSESYYVDLRDYDADSARITYDEEYVEVNKTYFTSSGNLKITAIDEGESTVKIKYDSGETVYLTIYCEYDGYNRYDEEEETYYVEEDEIVSYRIDLDDYRADKATITYSSTYVSVNKSSFTSSGTLKITAKKEGSSTVKVKYDSGTTIYLNIECEGYGNSNYDEEEEFDIDKGESVTYYIDLKDYRVNKATITYNSSYVSVNKTSFTSSGDLKITAKKEGESTVKIKYSSGDIISLYVTCRNNSYTVPTVNKTDGKDKTGKNYQLNTSINVDKTSLQNGYISGYTDGTFGPDLNITREEFGVMLSRMLSTTKSVSSNYYLSDVYSSWSKYEIAKLAAMGIVSSSGLYRPNDKITREEVAEMLYNTLNLTSFTTYCDLKDLGNSEIDKKVAKCYNAGIISGYPDGTFKGKSNITRAEVVKMLNRVFYEDNSTTKGNPFIDLTSSHWAYKDIVKAANK